MTHVKKEGEVCCQNLKHNALSRSNTVCARGMNIMGEMRTYGDRHTFVTFYSLNGAERRYKEDIPPASDVFTQRCAA